MMQDDFFSLFAYSRWADERLWEAVRGLTQAQYAQEPAPDCRSIHGTLVHMADATLIWVRRIGGETVTGRTSEADVPTLPDAVRFLERSHAAVADLLPTLTPEALAADLAYLDLRGQPKRLPLWAVLRHLPNHSSYHRGQITSRLMEFGVEPPLLDLALWAGRDDERSLSESNSRTY